MAPKNETGTERTIRGTVTAAKWDDEDAVTGVMIVTDDDEEYFVALKDTGKELLDLVDAEVELTGTISKKGGIQQIVVKDYKEVEFADSDDGEDSDDDEDEDEDGDSDDCDDGDDDEVEDEEEEEKG
jgi:hypothetical protein